MFVCLFRCLALHGIIRIIATAQSDSDSPSVRQWIWTVSILIHSFPSHRVSCDPKSRHKFTLERSRRSLTEGLGTVGKKQ